MKHGLLRSTATVGSMTMVSRILGFVRDMVFARLFGAGAGMDAFFVAFRIPNFLRRLFAEGAFSQAFVPVFADYQTHRDTHALKALCDHVTGTLGGILLIITLIGVVGAPLLVMLFAPGFVDDPVKFALTTDMLRITFPYLFFISLTALAAAILNSQGRFGVPALTPALLNIALIAAALWTAAREPQPMIVLAIGVFAAGMLQLGFQLPFLQRLGLLPRPRWGWRDTGVQRILKLMLPAIFGSSVAQVSLLLDTIIASFLATGSVSWLYYSDRLVEFPLGVFAIALATVILPHLSRQHAQSSPQAFAQTLDWGLRWVILVGIPSSIGLVLLAHPLLATLFAYGEFGVHDVHMAALSLTAFALGLFAFMLVKVLAPGFYAREDTRTPVRIGVISLGVSMLLNGLIVTPMVVFDIPGPHAGLALATTVAAYVNAGLLYRGLRRRNIHRPQPGWRGFWVRVIAANILMAVALWLGAGDTGNWLAYGASERVLCLSGLIVLAGAVYAACLYLFGVRVHKLP